jgi:hypothetical protein
MSVEDLDRVTEALHRFDEFVIDPTPLGIWCGRCSQSVVAGILNTEPTYVVAKCDCRTETRPASQPFTQFLWDVLNDIAEQEGAQ